MKAVGGAGGYGGPSTMNQDQRQPRYMPHINVTLYTRFSDNTTEVSCRDCKQMWTHPRGSRENTPATCDKVEIFVATDPEVVFDPYVTEDNQVRWRPRKC